MQIKYVMIYDDTGIPLYSRCFSNICSRIVKDDILFSAFLTALESSVKYNPSNVPDQLEINDQIVQIKSIGGRIQLKLEDMELIFYKETHKEYTIALGVPGDKQDENMESILNFFEGTRTVIDTTIGNKNWSSLPKDKIKEFEHKLVDQAIRPFFDMVGYSDQCEMGENCPFRVAVYDNPQEVGLIDRFKQTIDDFRSGSIMARIKNSISGILFPSKS